MCFYRKALSSNKPREVWKIIHRIIKPSYKPLHFDVEKLNKFFAEIPTRTIPNCECITLDQLNQIIEGLPERVPIDEQFTLKAVSRVDILNTIKSLKSDCSTGPDHIPVQFIKLAADQLADPLTVIINNCIANSQFPQIWKLARISPIPKNDSPSSEEELRPISILPALSKIFEKVVAKQIVEFIETNNLLPESMGGFRKGHSTATVLMGLRDDLLHAMKRSEVTLMVLADFTKAFDTVCFKTLLGKLNRLNFSKSFCMWMSNYLSSRSHYVQIDDRLSSTIQTDFGIPQGSILGPMLFNIYVNDLNNNMDEITKSFQYADDTNIYISCSSKMLAQRANDLNQTLKDIGSWSSSSNLALNPKKTKYMIVCTDQMARVHNLKDVKLNLEINGTSLDRVSITKVLGTYFQENMKWEEHVKQLTISCYGILRCLRKIKNFADFRLKRQLAESLVLTKLDYCDGVFYPLPDYLLKRLQKVQNAAASFVLGHYVKFPADITNLGWLPVRERRDWHVLQLVHKAMHNHDWPSYLKLEVRNHSRQLRSTSATTLTIPLITGTFQDSASKLFNILPDYIRNETDFSIFRSQTKLFLKERIIVGN